MIKGIIFDLDGTLADTMGDLQTAMNGMLSYLGYSERSRTDLLMAINNGAKEFVRRSLPKDVQNIDFILNSAIKKYEQEYSNCYLQKTAPYENVEAMLMNLKASGVKLAVLSNKQDKFVKDIIAKLFDKKTFLVVQGQDKLPTKPNPTSTLAICKDMGVKPTECLFVGDSDVDMLTAKNAGMRSVGVCWGYRGQEVLENAGATFLVKKAEDVCAIVNHLKDEIIKPKRKNKISPDAKTLTETCEFFNKKLLGTSELSIIKQSSTGEINLKALEQTGEHNTKKINKKSKKQ